MNKKLNLYIKDDEFDYVIDKGTLDALMCGSKLGTVLIKEMLRVLKPKGRLIIISHGSPEMRNQVFQPI
jgi:ubiquinone/menaquinone biosynthesis C-methylase UbiE